MAVVICLANQKGGVTKTTTAIAIADILMQSENKVLFVDTDPQCNSTGVYHAITEDVATLYDVLTNESSVAEAIQHTDVGDVLPCDPLLMQADVLIDMYPNKERLLKQALASVRDMYDYIIIDTPPSMGILLVNALVCADGVILPAKADRFDLEGVSQVGQTIGKVRASLNPQLKILGLLYVLVDLRTKIAQKAPEMFNQVAKDLGTIVFHTFIRNCITIPYSHAQSKRLSVYAPKSNAYKDYKKLVSEIQKVIREGS